VSSELTLLAEGTRMLDAARSFNELRDVRDLAIAAEAYAKAHKLGRDAQAYAVEIALLASRRMAEQDPPSKPWHGESTAGAVDIPQQRRSENRELLAVTEDELRVIVRGLRDPSRSRGHRLARDRRAKTRDPLPVPVVGAADIRLGDFREVLADVADGSIDVVLTDPPYPGEFLPLWSDLGAFAARVLRPDGLLVAMSGQLHLPEVYRRLSEHLPYRWTIAYVATGHATVVHARRIHSMWKPVVVYGGTSRRLYDLARSGFAEKRDHPWGQSESGFTSLLQLVADPGQFVCDPFLGAGTTAVVALRHGCPFIGAEIDETHYRTALGRVEREP
jgi:site-specific DNA-methyltransferase (adenine-specific)